jgi:hypothetical protein
MSKRNGKEQINFGELKRAFKRSGFAVVRTNEAWLLKNARGKVVKKRAVSARPQIYGLIVPDQFTIAVNRSLSFDEQMKTLLHELIHLSQPTLSESATERETGRLFKALSRHEQGYLEFLLS